MPSSAKRSRVARLQSCRSLIGTPRLASLFGGRGGCACPPAKRAAAGGASRTVCDGAAMAACASAHAARGRLARRSRRDRRDPCSAGRQRAPVSLPAIARKLANDVRLSRCTEAAATPSPQRRAAPVRPRPSGRGRIAALRAATSFASILYRAHTRTNAPAKALFCALKKF